MLLKCDWISSNDLSLVSGKKKWTNRIEMKLKAAKMKKTFYIWYIRIFDFRWFNTDRWNYRIVNLWQKFWECIKSLPELPMASFIGGYAAPIIQIDIQLTKTVIEAALGLKEKLTFFRLRRLLNLPKTRLEKICCDEWWNGTSTNLKEDNK